MRKDIFESEEEFIDVISKTIIPDVDDTPDVAESVKEAKRLELIKQSPFDKMETAWDKFRPQKYYHEDWNGLYVNYNDQWANAATAVIDAQEKVIEYLKQKLEEQK
jgi:hypothetical protein